jgi:hypothetical protein
VYRVHVELPRRGGTERPRVVELARRPFVADKLGRPWCAQDAALAVRKAVKRGRTKSASGATATGGWVLGWKDGQPLYFNLRTGVQTTEAPAGVDGRTVPGTPAPLVSRSKRAAALERALEAATIDLEGGESDDDAEEREFAERTLSFAPAFG